LTAVRFSGECGSAPPPFGKIKDISPNGGALRPEAQPLAHAGDQRRASTRLFR
jgi:hypothetical protein